MKWKRMISILSMAVLEGANLGSALFHGHHRMSASLSLVGRRFEPSYCSRRRNPCSRSGGFHSRFRLQHSQVRIPPSTLVNDTLPTETSDSLLSSTSTGATTAHSPFDAVPFASSSSSDSSSSIYVQDAEALSKLKSPFLQTLRDRGFLHQCTAIADLDAKLMTTATTATNSNDIVPISAYLGFDATADSLHVGSLLQIMILRHLQLSGHRPVVLVGGGTSKIGDPTGKDESRVLLTDERIDANIKGISNVFSRFLKFENNMTDREDQDRDTTSDNNTMKNDEPKHDPTNAILVNNNDWLSELKYLDFLREYGTHFTINRMLSFESVKQRLEREAPFSFLEFNYMILQAYDFLELYRRHGTLLQLGGSDQWGNMVSGTELGRRICDGVQLFALTAPLITTQDGKKMGKTANGAVWLNSDKCSEYDYWQFWRNTDDADVIRFLKLFTELPLTEIAKLAELQGSDINQAKIVLADETTRLLHGPECLSAIRATASNMFAGAGTTTEGLPRVFVSKSAVTTDGANLLDLLVELKLVTSKKEGRRLIQGGGARIGDQPVTDDVNPRVKLEDFVGANEIILRAGKKRAGVVEIQANPSSE